MNVLDIPFNHFVGIEPLSDPEYLLTLPAKQEYCNHIQTIHASALFALAEASSGMYLLREFGDVENAMPVVRNVQVKYKKPAQGAVYSKGTLQGNKTEILQTLQTKRRALISIHVSIFDANAVLIMQATFEWFVLIN